MILSFLFLLLYNQSSYIITSRSIGEYAFCSDITKIKGKVIVQDEYDIMKIDLGSNEWIILNYNEGGIFRISTNSKRYMLENGIRTGMPVASIFYAYPDAILDNLDGVTIVLPNELIYFRTDISDKEGERMSREISFDQEKLVNVLPNNALITSIGVIGFCKN